jgi:hypothetical protein
MAFCNDRETASHFETKLENRNVEKEDLTAAM